MWHVCYTPINYINQNYKCEWMAQPASSATLISWICNTHIHPQFAHTAPHATWVKYTQNSFFLLSRFELHAFDARYSSWYVLTVVAMLMSVEKKSHFSTKWKVHTLRLTLVRYGGNCLHSTHRQCCAVWIQLSKLIHSIWKWFGRMKSHELCQRKTGRVYSHIFIRSNQDAQTRDLIRCDAFSSAYSMRRCRFQVYLYFAGLFFVRCCIYLMAFGSNLCRCARCRFYILFARCWFFFSSFLAAPNTKHFQKIHKFVGVGEIQIYWLPFDY